MLESGTKGRHEGGIHVEISLGQLKVDIEKVLSRHGERYQLCASLKEDQWRYRMSKIHARKEYLVRQYNAEV